MSFPIAFPALTHPDKAVKGSGDRIIISESPCGLYYLLEYNALPDNRYSTEFLSAYIDAIDYVRLKGTPKVLVTTSRIPKFFSNGLDFNSAAITPDYIENYYYKVMRAYLEFPWPTIAVLPGHAFAAGFMLAACNDFRVMNPQKGFLCLNEMEFGADLHPAMMSIFRVKFGTAVTFKTVMQAHRWTGPAALEAGIVDAVGGIPEAEAMIKGIVGKYVKSPAWPGIRKELLREVLDDTNNWSSYVRTKAGYLKVEKSYYQLREAQLDKKLKQASKL